MVFHLAFVFIFGYMPIIPHKKDIVKIFNFSEKQLIKKQKCGIISIYKIHRGR